MPIKFSRPSYTNIICLLVIVPIAFFLGAIFSPQLKAYQKHLSAALYSNFEILSNQRDNELISKYDKIDWSTGQPANLDEIQADVQISPKLRAHVLKSFLSTTYPSFQKRFSVDLLMSNPTPEYATLAYSLLSANRSPKEREDGMNLLVKLPYSPKNQKFLREQFFLEKDPSVLSFAVSGIVRSEAPEPKISQAIVDKLHTLTTHPSWDVRMTSIQKLAEWDTKGELFLSDVIRLMQDENIEVRIAAIGATSISRAQDPLVKKSLLDILANAKE